MKTIYLIALCCLSKFNFAQKNTHKQFYFAFEDKTIELTTELKERLNDFILRLPIERPSNITFLNKTEDKMANLQRYRLSYNRAIRVADHINATKDLFAEATVFFEPFESGSKKKTGTNKSYRAMTQASGVYSVLLKKKYTPITVYTSAGNNIANIIKPPQCDSIFLTKDNIIYGEQGTIVHIPANSLVLKSGRKLTSDKGLVCLQEFYSLADMVAADLCTKSGDKMLISAGMVNIEAKCTQGHLRLRAGTLISVFMPTDTSTSKKMKAFNGRKVARITDWYLSNKGSIERIGYGDELFEEQTDFDGEEGYEEDGYYAESDGYLLKSAKLGWINCDAFYEVKNKTDLLVKLNDDRGLSVRVVFKGMKSVLPAHQIAGMPHVMVKDVPIGAEVTVLAFVLSKDKKQALFGAMNYTIEADGKIDLDVTKMTIDKMKTAMVTAVE